MGSATQNSADVSSADTIIDGFRTDSETITGAFRTISNCILAALKKKAASLNRVDPKAVEMAPETEANTQPEFVIEGHLIAELHEKMLKARIQRYEAKLYVDRKYRSIRRRLRDTNQAQTIEDTAPNSIEAAQESQQRRRSEVDDDAVVLARRAFPPRGSQVGTLSGASRKDASHKDANDERLTEAIQEIRAKPGRFANFQSLHEEIKAANDSAQTEIGSKLKRAEDEIKELRIRADLADHEPRLAEANAPFALEARGLFDLAHGPLAATVRSVKMLLAEMVRRFHYLTGKAGRAIRRGYRYLREQRELATLKAIDHRARELLARDYDAALDDLETATRLALQAQLRRAAIAFDADYGVLYRANIESQSIRTWRHLQDVMEEYGFADVTDIEPGLKANEVQRAIVDGRFQIAILSEGTAAVIETDNFSLTRRRPADLRGGALSGATA